MLTVHFHKIGFLSTPSARRATPAESLYHCHHRISIHALREEGDDRLCDDAVVAVRFLSTPSARRATVLKMIENADSLISIHALREEGDSVARMMSPAVMIFLSTPSARRATRGGHGVHRHGDDFYPRPPRGGRLPLLGVCGRAKAFLSTPSARRATAKTETKSLFSNKLYNILHEFRRALIYNGSKSYPNHAK